MCIAHGGDPASVTVMQVNAPPHKDLVARYWFEEEGAGMVLMN